MRAVKKSGPMRLPGNPASRSDRAGRTLHVDRAPPARDARRQDPSFASTLANGLAVLEAFDIDAPLLGNSELAARTGLTRPTVARLSSSLARLGYLRYLPGPAKYTLWTGPLRAAYPFLAHLPFPPAARSAMQALADDLHAAVTLVVMDGDRGLVLDASRGTEFDEHHPALGLSAPLIRIAVGRAMLALLPDGERSAVLEALAAREPRDWSKYGQTVLDGIRDTLERGVCVSRGDWRSHIHSAGVPLLRTPEGICYGLSCGIAAFRLRPGQLEDEVAVRLSDLRNSIRAMLRDAE